MHRLHLTIAVIAFITAVAAAVFGLRLDHRHERLELALAGLEARERAPTTVHHETIAPGLEQLVARVAFLESNQSRVPVARDDERDASNPNRESEFAEEPEQSRTPPNAQDVDAFEELLEEMIAAGFAPDWPKEKSDRFWMLARDTDLVERRISELEGQLERDPRDLEARMLLANHYLAKLATVPGGPEQGRWGALAEAQWQAAQEVDPQHWESASALGTNYAYYPDFLNKTSDAIAMLEHARELQAQLVPSPEHVPTYLLLARMYVRKGKRDEARAVLESGLQFHPAESSLLAELEGL